MKILVWAILVVALGMSAWTASNPSRFWPWSAAPKVITGHARVIDGDTIAVGKVRVRLEGIDAPETDQKCRDSAGRDYLCGITASKALRNLIGREPVACERVGQDRYGRVLGVCSNAAGVDMSAELVRRGLAVAFRRYSIRYAQVEDAARTAGAGLWSGTFEHPSCFRAARDGRPCKNSIRTHSIISPQVSEAPLPRHGAPMPLFSPQPSMIRLAIVREHTNGLAHIPSAWRRKYFA